MFKATGNFVFPQNFRKCRMENPKANNSCIMYHVKLNNNFERFFS